MRPSREQPAAGEGGSGTVLQSGERLRLLTAAPLQRMEDLCGRLQREVASADTTGLQDALGAHAAATAALRVDLLVPQGLRASTSRRDEATFRAQVVALAHCAERSWSTLRAFMAQSGQALATLDPLQSELVMEARTLQRRRDDAAAVLQALREDAAPHASAAPLLRRAAAIDALCESAGQARRMLSDLEQERAALHAALTVLARTLGGGLLEKLRVFVAQRFGAASAEMLAAQEAQHALHELLLDAAHRLARFDQCRQQALAVLAALGPLLAAAR